MKKGDGMYRIRVWIEGGASEIYLVEETDLDPAVDEAIDRFLAEHLVGESCPFHEVL